MVFSAVPLVTSPETAWRASFSVNEQASSTVAEEVLVCPTNTHACRASTFEWGGMMHDGQLGLHPVIRLDQCLVTVSRVA